MEKKLYELTIDPEIQGLMPPLRDSEKELLEASLLENGCLDPILVWDDTIIDGHTRYALCRKHHIPFSVRRMDFEDKNEAALWATQNQMARRNLSAFQRCEMVAHLEPLIRKGAHARMVSGKVLPAGAERGKTGYIMARMAGVSHGNWDKVKFLIENADAETKRRLREGEISIHSAYMTLRMKMNPPQEEPASQTVRKIEIFVPAMHEPSHKEIIAQALFDLKNKVASGMVGTKYIIESLDAVSEMVMGTR